MSHQQYISYVGTGLPGLNQSTEPMRSLNNFKPEKINVGPLATHRAPIKDSDQTARMRRLI